ncbi:MAG: hypothetical protein Q9218_007761, partial [Villophora microphyllina]
MGIKGVYGEIGPGERVALSKLAVEHFEKHGRPLRIAIDASIWEFQTQAGKGGSNPALRTLYYRLLRLISWSIQPLFIFDGPNKPPFKRNVKTGSSLPNFITKQLLQLFGVPYHTAPGEAEAECALLQKEGIIDAVLSEDVDTMMFGCTVQLRNWSSENTRGNKVPTHVNVYRSEATKQGKSGLDSDGMILIALMSGGDYIPAGITGCGIKIACEAAKAGFGRDLCRLDNKDTVGFNQWRERLEYELHVNESGIFRRRHKALNIPEKFPDRKVLRYYTNPAVSTAPQIARLREEINWDCQLDLSGLRRFVSDAFEWKNLSGAKKFIRGLAPALLVDQFRRRYQSTHADGDLEAQEAEERTIVTAICDRRTHFITDAVPELRVAYTPIHIVGLDLGAEEPDLEVVEMSDSGDEGQDEAMRSRSRSPTKRAASKYDPTQPEKIWILESYVKFGVPLMVENWEADMRDPKKFATRKARERAATAKKTKRPEVMKPGAMDAYVKTMKPGVDRRKALETGSISHVFPQKANEAPSTQASPRKNPTRDSKAGDQLEHPTPRKAKPTKVSLSSRNRTPSKDSNVNPWTLAKRPPETMSVKLRPGTRYSALGIYEPSSPTTRSSPSMQLDEVDNTDLHQLPTPISEDSGMRRCYLDAAAAKTLESFTFRKVDRRLSFTHPGTQSQPVTPDSLPSPSLLIPVRRGVLPAGTQEDLPLPKPLDGTGKAGVRARGLLALRESLD